MLHSNREYLSLKTNIPAASSNLAPGLARYKFNARKHDKFKNELLYVKNIIFHFILYSLVNEFDHGGSNLNHLH